MSVQTQITRIENAKTAIKTAIEGKGVTVQPDTKIDGMAALIDSIKAVGGGEVLNFFGGSKYYITEVTPSYDAREMMITPDDITILDSPKFLLVTQDVPATRNAIQKRVIARMPSPNTYASAIIAFSIGKVFTQCYVYLDPSSGIRNERVYAGIDGGDVFNMGITNISGNSIILNPSSDQMYFKGGQPYKVLLIG